MRPAGKTAELSGKAAIVTGAGRGIGAATAKRLAERDATVAVNDSPTADPAEAEAVVATIRAAGGEAFPVIADVGDRASVTAMVDEVVRTTGRLDVLVSNAAQYVRRDVCDVDEEHLDQHFRVNFRGAVFTSQAAAPHMSRGGRIIFVTSGLARRLAPGGAAYAASKAATESLTRSCAMELGPSGITVNAVAPGIVDTAQLAANLSEEGRADLVAKTALGRVGQPDDIAKAISLLATDEAGWINGQVLDVDGGLG